MNETNKLLIKIIERLDNHESRMDSMESKIDLCLGTLSAMQPQVAKIPLIEERLGVVKDKVDLLSRVLKENNK